VSEMIWTKEIIEERLFEAAEVLRRLPEERVQGYFNTWPKIVHSFDDLVGQQPRLRRPLPSPQAIDRMETTLTWLGWLEPDVAKLAWTRAERTQWKKICWKFGISRATAHRRWDYALSMIVWQLSRGPAPAKRSRAMIVSRVRSDEMKLGM